MTENREGRRPVNAVSSPFVCLHWGEKISLCSPVRSLFTTIRVSVWIF